MFDVGGTMFKVALSGGTTLALMFAYKTKFPSTLFSYHPTLLGLSWLALTPFAIKYLRESKQEKDKKGKEAKVQTHAYINAAVTAFTFGGLAAIYRNKELNAAAKKEVAKHLVSLHAKAGITGAALAVIAVAISIYKTYFAKAGGAANYIWTNKFHRWAGILSYLVNGLAIVLIVNGPWGKFNLGKPWVSVVTAAIVSIQALVFGAFLIA